MTTDTETHRAQLLEKQGLAWTNDLGKKFPPEKLYRYRCWCGWKGACWYADESKARGHFNRHMEVSQ